MRSYKKFQIPSTKLQIFKHFPSPQSGEGKGEGVRDSNLSPSSFSSPLWGEESLKKISSLLGIVHFGHWNL